jgi:hypothetical protein
MYILFVVTVEECLVGERVGSPNCSKQKEKELVYGQTGENQTFL